MSTAQAYRALQKAADALGRDDIGTHTMRKTFGYHHYKSNKDVATLQHIFNHSVPSITLKYIGITSDEINATMEDFPL
ncbi:tyrosine-type recombinase/integrase [Lysinibacillus sphaericus]|uniref:tyrosine-type recombinase/integrase n=1 Tax=Lysinibacillus sphaericus TaxID=1421 RepID=UPI003D72983B